MPRSRRERRGLPARRVYFFKERATVARGDDGLSCVWREKRLAQHGTALPTAFPWRARCVAVGVLAIEVLDGASERSLESLGLSARQARDIFHRIERITVTTIYFQNGPNAGAPYDQDEATLFESSARTISFNSDAYEVGDRESLRLTHTITALSGTGALAHVQIETRKDSSDTWRVADAFPVATATGTYRKVFKGLDRFVRAVVTIAGSTPSVTSSLSGEAV